MDGFGFIGLSGEAIYENFMNAPGAAPLAAAADLVKQLADEFDASMQSITDLSVTMQQAWQGNAAGAAERGAGPLVMGLGMAVPEINKAQDLSHQQAGSFNQARNPVNPVPPAPS